MVVDGENITGLERGRPAEPPPFPKPEIHYSKYAGNPFFSSGFRCHDRHKRLHDLKGAGIGRAPYVKGPYYLHAGVMDKASGILPPRRHAGRRTRAGVPAR